MATGGRHVVVPHAENSVRRHGGCPGAARFGASGSISNRPWVQLPTAPLVIISAWRREAIFLAPKWKCPSLRRGLARRAHLALAVFAIQRPSVRHPAWEDGPFSACFP